MPSVPSEIKVVTRDDDDDSYKCGYWRCTPKWLQPLHTAQVALVFMSVAVIVQGFVVNGVLPVGISTVERRFYLDSTKTGFWAATYDVSTLLMLFPLSYYGRRAHKARYLGIGLLLIGIGTLVMTIPQFISGDYTKNVRSNSTGCSAGASEPECDSEYVSSMQNMWYILLLGNLIVGIGASPLYTYGVAYLDENVSQQASGLYCGIYNAMSVLGPALGFVCGARLLSIWGDIDKIPYEETTLAKLPAHEQGRQFYGNWWLGFIIAGIIGLVNGVVLLAFGRRLRGASKHRAKDIVQTDAHHVHDHSFDSSVKQLFKASLSLLRNTTFTMLIIVQTVDSFLLNGMTTFIPKIFETLFSLDETIAPLYAGAIIIPSSIIGSIVGGYLIRRFHWHCAHMMRAVALFSFISLGLSFALLIECPQAQFAGVTDPYPGASDKSIALKSTCNAQCNCIEQYEPVCDEKNGVQYSSACYAGCTSSTNGVFSSCSCLNDTLGTSVSNGPCPPPESCDSRMYLFMILFSLSVLVTFLTAQPMQQALLRSVPFAYRELGLCVSWIFMRLIGTIPGAVVFGAAFDGACSIWRVDTCTRKRMACERYDNATILYSLLVIALVVKATQVISMLTAAHVYRPTLGSPSSPNLPNRNIHSNNNAGLESTETTNGPATFTVDDRVRPTSKGQPRVQQF